VIRTAKCRIALAAATTLVLWLMCSPLDAQNPIPQIVGPVKPTAVAPGSGAFTLTVYGANFVPGAVVNWNGQPRSTKFVSAHELQAQILALDVVKNTAGTITVTNPAPGGGNSSASFAQVEVHEPTAMIVPANPILAPMQYPFNDGGAIVLADFNGDNKLDLMYGGVATLGRSDGTFRFSQILHNWSFLGLGMAYGDFNNDGRLDLAYVGGNAVNVRGQAIQIMLGDGTGKFNKGPRLIFNPKTYAFTWLVTGDFNRDGKLDIVAQDLDTIYSYLGNGDGTFYKREEYPFPGQGQGFSLQTGDFNNDGILDILTVDRVGGLYLMLGNGDGTFQPAVLFAATGISGCEGFGQQLPLISDFNEDGILDLAVCYVASDQIGILLGNGDGTFQPPSLYYEGENGFFCAVSGDFNSDGHPDILLSNYTNDDYILFPGNGDGTLQSPQRFLLPGKTPYSCELGMAAADVNADGLLDFVVVDNGGFDIVIVQK
jgi:hypothetical protein